MKAEGSSIANQINALENHKSFLPVSVSKDMTTKKLHLRCS